MTDTTTETSHSLERTLQRIYDAEVNVTISTFWDGGYDISIGGAPGYTEPKLEWTVEYADEIEPFLRQAFGRLFNGYAND